MNICYFGIFNPDFSRNRIYIKALEKAGHNIMLCNDNSPGFSKYVKLWKKHRKIADQYDVMIVGYPGHIVVPLAKFWSKKPVIADALGSLYDAELNSHKPTFFRKIKSFLADYFLVKFADKILLESFSQKKYFEEKFGKSSKYEVVYTGVDEKFEEYKDNRLKTSDDKFLVVFRGKLTPESGIMHILKSAELLKQNQNINFKIIGSGYLLKETEEFIKEHNLSNTNLITEYLSVEDLILKITEADLMLGQFESNPRLNRTIPHKAFEAFALGVPYLTSDAPAVKEIVEDGINAFLVPPSDSLALANKIEFLSKQSDLLLKVSINARKVFDERCSSGALSKEINFIMLQCQNGKS